MRTSRRRRAVSIAIAGLLAACSTVSMGVGLSVERDVRDPMGSAIGVQANGCGTSFDVLIALPDLAVVDRMIEARDRASGMYEAGDMRLYFGSVEEAASGFGATALFIGTSGEAWIRTGPGTARQIVEFVTPGGRAVWLLAGGSSTGPCGIR